MYEKLGEMVLKTAISEYDTIIMKSSKHELSKVSLEYLSVQNAMPLFILLYSNYNYHSKWNVLEYFYTKSGS